IGQLLVDIDEAPLLIFHEKEQPGNMVEQVLSQTDDLILFQKGFEVAAAVAEFHGRRGTCINE
ncbi:MAG: hypothetical protein AAFY98_01695, partial [Verrucomicrobiota bacterium]